MSWREIIFYFFTYGILIYSILLISFYLFIGLYSIGETRKYIRKNKNTDYRLLAVSSQAPSISILAPAYNEGVTVVDNVRSLLSIHYNNLEVIIINDGSKDDSLEKLIKAYDLYKTEYFVHEQIATKRVRGVYKSRNPIYRKLVVVDKENGGKADALNVGLNIANHDYIVCIDVDCILEQDALLKMAKPFLEDNDNKRVIATGGVVRIANSCIIESGRLVKAHLPKKFLPRVQTLEYIRAFLLGRMAWSRLNGLLLISGAFGAFDKEIVIKSGGYNHNTVGEDMELVVRMRRYMEMRKLPYKITYIPDPLCWTEAPDTYKILGRQRNRWARGTIETLWLHRAIFFNPKYGLLGMLSYPYWFFFEYLAPIIEAIGFIVFLVFAYLGIINWPFFFLILGFILLFGFTYSVFAILMEVMTYNQYKRYSDILRLVITAFLEPFLFHPFVVWSSIQGNIDLVRRKNTWGEMTRTGFAGDAEVKIENNLPKEILYKLNHATVVFASFSLVWLFILFALSTYEFIFNGLEHQFPEQIQITLLQVLGNDVLYWLKISSGLYVLFTAISFFSSHIAKRIYVVTAIVLTVTQIALINYFSTALVPLGADLYGYSIKDIKQTLGASGGVNNIILAGILLGIIMLWLAFKLLPSKIKLHPLVAVVLPLLSFGALFSSFTPDKMLFKSEYVNNLVLNKSDFFFKESFLYFFPNEPAQKVTPSEGDLFAAVDPQYPFLHKENTSDVLTPFFSLMAEKPNVVIVLVEGLGRAFTNEGAYLGNFTPFVDSLAVKSLYWKNFLSSGGRTFAVLPSMMGSLPFLKNGFLEMGEQMPSHLSLLSLLKLNGYRTSFYYGGDSKFDNMNIFLKKNAIDEINDEGTFPVGYTKLPKKNGYSWGYNDKELFRCYLDTRNQMDSQPQLSVLLTVATHSPFMTNEQEKYLKRFEQRMNELRFDDAKKNISRNYKDQYASILYADDALRGFFNRYSKRADFKNTIFLITGDHRMPEIPMNTKLDRYHVPLIIYSPLLKRTATFNSVSTHFDIAPSLLAFLHQHYGLKKPSLVTWIGNGLDTAREFRNIHTYPLMQTKNSIEDFVMGEYHLNGNSLFKVYPTMDEELIEDQEEANRIKATFGQFKVRNEKMIKGAKNLPDSLYKKYFPVN